MGTGCEIYKANGTMLLDSASMGWFVYDAFAIRYNDTLSGSKNYPELSGLDIQAYSVPDNVFSDPMAVTVSGTTVNYAVTNNTWSDTSYAYWIYVLARGA